MTSPEVNESNDFFSSLHSLESYTFTMFSCISQVLKRCFSCILVSNSFRLTKAKKKKTQK